MIRILFVDDDPDIRDLMTEELMEHDGIQVESSPSAADAIQVLFHKRFDAIVSDIRMSGIDGLGLFRTISPLYPGLIFILYSGGECDDRIQSALEDGLDFYIQRSGDLEGDVSTLLSVLHGRIHEKNRRSLPPQRE